MYHIYLEVNGIVKHYIESTETEVEAIRRVGEIEELDIGTVCGSAGIRHNAENDYVVGYMQADI